MDWNLQTELVTLFKLDKLFLSNILIDLSYNLNKYVQ